MAFIYWYIRDFFLFIGEIIVFIIAFIGAFIDMLFESVQFLASVIGALPTVLSVGAGVLTIVCVLYKVLGRESSS